MPPTVTRSFGVLGSPISHSRSPALHRAAIAALGIDATYGSTDVSSAELPRFIESLDDTWDGLSLTMPLKQTVRPLLVAECPISTLTGAVNTAVRGQDGWEGINTDVWGASTAIRQHGVAKLRRAILLGAGATASSLVVALHDLGVETLAIVARDSSRTVEARELAQNLGMEAHTALFGQTLDSSDILVSSLPSDAVLTSDAIECLDAELLFDVVYEPWPSALGKEWAARGLESISGLHMLLWQAVRQARLFYGESADEPLPDEELVVTAMRAAVGL
jgi:shikimate dehydrogenase